MLVEKPLTTNTGDARSLVALARSKDRQIIVPYGWNFKPFTAEARRLVSGVGKIEHVILQMASALEDLFAGEPMKETEGAVFRPPASTWADPKRSGGYGWGQLVHALGLLFRVADLEPAEVFALVGKSPTGVDYYDAVSVRFSGGATASMSGASTVPEASRLPDRSPPFRFGRACSSSTSSASALSFGAETAATKSFPCPPATAPIAAKPPVALLVDLCLGRKAENPGRRRRRHARRRGARRHVSLGGERQVGEMLAG